jgi:hypothetical protein
MVETYRECVKVCKGLTAFVVGHGKGLHHWSATPELLVADLVRAGFHVRPNLFFHRYGIPGSGQKDWLRADTERIVCVTAAPGKLPWADVTAMGHKPKWAPGGEMSNRLSSGARVNQWGHSIDSGGGKTLEGGVQRSGAPPRPSHRLAKTKFEGRDKWGNAGVSSGEGRNPDGTRKTRRRITRGKKDGDTVNSDSYGPPVLANPGNCIEEVPSSLIHLSVGGGVMGSKLAHVSEAPFPLKLAEFFIRSFCPPGGLVVDCFCGSSTTGHAAIEAGRRYMGCDIRESQVKLSRKRLETITPPLFADV